MSLPYAKANVVENIFVETLHLQSIYVLWVAAYLVSEIYGTDTEFPVLTTLTR